MPIDRKSVTIHYRKFSRAATVQTPLENLIRAAMDTTKDAVQVKNRYRARLQTQGSDNFFINTYMDGSGAAPLVFGDILHFTKGHLQALCETADQDASSLPVQQMKAPERSEYVHSQMFWMVKGDHAFVVQSMSLRTEDFEKYLDWLLKTNTAVLQEGHPIILDAKFDADAIGGDLGDIQEIVVGGIASNIPAPTGIQGGLEQEREVVQHNQVGTARKAGWDTAKAILRELLGGDANVASLMQAVPADAELNVQVHIGYQTKKRKIDRTALRQLETGLRNLPDSQLQVNAKGIKKSADGTIRLHHNASIRLIKAQDGDNQLIGTLLDPTDVLRAMFEAFTTFVANGKIQDDEH
jgi:hypothetical protein